ncbi:MAG TPA: hypothetical protein VKC66_08305 [Xanthobacteraceae bacterium]|nr:hypothetical protein [Xanthobacteraceae bacterium]
MNRLALHPTDMFIGRHALIGTSMAMDCFCRTNALALLVCSLFRPTDASDVNPLGHILRDHREASTKPSGKRCVALMQQRDTIRASTLFYWWPDR